MGALQQEEIAAFEYIFEATFKDNPKNHGCGVPNRRTIDAMEKVLEEAEKCNKNLSRLITQLLGIAIRGRGWLMRILKQLGKELSFKFRMCLTFTAGYYYKSVVIETMYQC
ncbi:MAG: hypothetical protein OEZ43_11470 [Gammaproteobacteria bacterium]|nr:hypothetical protein [Gammaproteobacteria bacterium]